MKTCRKCGAEKPIDDFPLTTDKGKPYRKPYCKECITIMNREYKRKSGKKGKKYVQKKYEEFIYNAF